MMRKFLLLFPVVATTTAGIGVIAVLSAGYGTLSPILIGAAVGLAVAVPATWLVAKQLA